MSHTLSPKNFDDGDNVQSEDSAGEMTWPKPDFDKHLRAAAVLKNLNIMRKKRVHSASFSHSGVSGLTIDGVPYDVHALTSALRRSGITSRTPYSKNSRKSRDGRRVPSKRGGKKHDDPTDVLDEIVLDHNDPDYDSDVNDPVTIETMNPPLSDEEFERIFKSLMKEFFIHGKTDEVIDALNDLNLASHHRRQITYLAVTVALQLKQTQYELTSELLSDMCGKVINQAHIQQGFMLILNELGELTIDFPRAPEHVGRFLARAMADDILPPRFVELQKSIISQALPDPPQKEHKPMFINSASSPPTSAPPVGPHTDSSFDGSARPARPGTRNLSDSYNGTHHAADPDTTATSSGIGSASSLPTVGVTNPVLAMKALIQAESFLTLSHAFARLDNIWGVPVGPKATKLLMKKIRRLLMAYMDTNDVDEATSALLELDSPHFHHELVFQAVIMAIELSTDDARERIINLLKDLCLSVVITPNQFNLGIRRVYNELPDLQLDVPAAYVLMERFMNAACAAGFASKALVAELPAKPRKRFISETDSVYRQDKTYPL